MNPNPVTPPGFNSEAAVKAKTALPKLNNSAQAKTRQLCSLQDRILELSKSPTVQANQLASLARLWLDLELYRRSLAKSMSQPRVSKGVVPGQLAAGAVAPPAGDPPEPFIEPD